MISASNSPKKNPGWFLCDSQALCDKLIRINTYNDLVHAAGQHPNFQGKQAGVLLHHSMVRMQGDPQQKVGCRECQFFDHPKSVNLSKHA